MGEKTYNAFEVTYSILKHLSELYELFSDNKTGKSFIKHSGATALFRLSDFKDLNKFLDTKLISLDALYCHSNLFNLCEHKPSSERIKNRLVIDHVYPRNYVTEKCFKLFRENMEFSLDDFIHMLLSKYLKFCSISSTENKMLDIIWRKNKEFKEWKDAYKLAGIVLVDATPYAGYIGRTSNKWEQVRNIMINQGIIKYDNNNWIQS